MRLTQKQLRRIIQEELQELGWRGGGYLKGEKPMPLVDEQLARFNPEAKNPMGYDIRHEGPFNTEQECRQIVLRKISNANKAREEFMWAVQQDRMGKFYAVELEVVA